MITGKPVETEQNMNQFFKIYTSDTLFYAVVSPVSANKWTANVLTRTGCSQMSAHGLLFVAET
jgi:hypothetical protein